MRNLKIFILLLTCTTSHIIWGQDDHLGGKEIKDSIVNKINPELSNSPVSSSKTSRKKHKKSLSFYLSLDSLLSSSPDFKLKESRLYDYYTIQFAIEQSIKKAENRGYPFYKIEQELIQEQPLILALKADLGPYIVIDSVINIGNASILPGVMASLSEIKPKEAYNEKNLQKFQKRINNYSYLSAKQAPKLVLETSNNKLYVQIDKNKGSNFNGIIGIQPDAKTGKASITGDLDLKLRNVFSHAEKIDLKWQRLADQTQKLNINADLPFIFKSNFGIAASFELYKRDTSFLYLSPVLALKYYLGSNQWLRLFYQSEQNNVLTQSMSLSLNNNNEQTSNYRINSFGLGWNLTQLDYPFNPRKGLNMDLSISYGIKKLNRTTTMDSVNINDIQVNYTTNIQWFIPLFKKQTLYLGLNSAYNSAENLYYNELYRIGGNELLRGFDEESFFASWYQCFTIEYRFLYEKNSNFFIFYDLAYWEQKYLDNFEFDWPFGFGIGTRFGSKIGIFSISYALGKSFNNPIEFRNGKVHFGYSALF